MYCGTSIIRHSMGNKLCQITEVVGLWNDSYILRYADFTS